MILWFFLIVSWNGDVLVKHGFPSLEACVKKQAHMSQLLKPTMREVTDCTGIPIGQTQELQPKEKKKGV